MRLILLVFSLVALADCAVAAQSRNWTGDPARAAAELEEQWRIVADPQRAVPIRGTVHFALEATGLGWHSERVGAALARARSMQDLDPKSPTFGNFKWRSEHEAVFDQNAVEFASQMLGLMDHQFAAQLTPEVRRSLETIMTDAIEALRGHKVKIEYTNIFVMKAWALMAFGEALHRPDVAEDGYRRFAEWLRFTARNGLTEYGGVNYYGVDLDSLGLIAKFAGRVETRTQAMLALRYLWTDIAANWWAPGDRLGGANSRSYDYLFGRGYLEAHTWPAGFLRERPVLEGANWLPGPHENQSVLRDADTLVPPSGWTDGVRAEMPRTVVQRWGDQLENHAIQWIGHHVSIGSAGASRGSDERTLVVNLGDTPAVPEMVLFMDGRNDAYGTKKIANAASQAKALHLTPFIATVQRGPDVLQLLSDEPLGPKSKHKAGELACLLSQLTIPATAGVWFGDERAQPGSAESPAQVPDGRPVFVRLGDAVVGLRFLLATKVGGGTAPIHFIADSSEPRARRLTAVHSVSEPHGRATIAVWLRVGDGVDDAGFRAFRKSFGAVQVKSKIDGDEVEMEVAGQNGPLRIAADLARQERRVLSGGEPDALLSVNGRDVGREILAEFLK